VGEAKGEGDIGALDIAEIAHPAAKGPDDVHPRGGGERRQQANERLTRRLLRARRERPRCRAAKQRDELASFHLPAHSITSSARASSVGGTVRPSVPAVWALMTSSNLVGCRTGRSAGFSPLRMRPT